MDVSPFPSIMTNSTFIESADVTDVANLAACITTVSKTIRVECAADKHEPLHTVLVISIHHFGDCSGAAQELIIPAIGQDITDTSVYSTSIL